MKHINKCRERTEALRQATARRRMHEMADSGVIVALNEVKNPKTTVLANIMFEAQRQQGVTVEVK